MGERKTWVKKKTRVKENKGEKINVCENFVNVWVKKMGEKNGEKTDEVKMGEKNMGENFVKSMGEKRWKKKKHG